MFTFPSVLTYKERNAEEGEVDKQELKIEFIMESEDWEFTRKTGKEIFAVESDFEYQLLPVSHLFADKFTTINKLEALLRSPRCPFVLYVGKKKLVKRKEFEKFISENVEI